MISTETWRLSEFSESFSQPSLDVYSEDDAVRNEAHPPFLFSPDWQRQLAKFASVQDRLRDWKPDVAAKLMRIPCLMIEALDIDGIRIDKATQVNVAFAALWANSTRACAKEKYNKDNFFIPGEVTGGDTFGSLYM